MLRLMSKKIRMKKQLRLWYVTLVEEKKKGCYVYIYYCVEGTQICGSGMSASVILFGHVVPLIHLVSSIKDFYHV